MSEEEPETMPSLERRIELDFRTNVWLKAERIVDGILSDNLVLEPYKSGGGFHMSITTTVLDQRIDAVMRVADWLMEMPEVKQEVSISPTFNFGEMLNNLTSVSKDGSYVLESREAATNVVAAAREIVDKYEVVTRADLHEMLGLPTTHEDTKVGWITASNFEIKQTRQGWLLIPSEPTVIPT